MTDITCTFAGDREHTLIAYLYDDIDPAERAAFERHLPACARCRHDLTALGGVRQRLASWQPPVPQVSSLKSQVSTQPSQPSQPLALSPQPWYRQVPAWAQVAAALLFLGVSAGIANLDVRYDANGLSVRTGWSRPSPSGLSEAAARAAAQPAAAPIVNQMNPVTFAKRDEVAALEQQLRNEIRAVSAAQHASAADAETLRRVRALIDESEKREERELALRVAQVLRDVNAQRQADLSKIDHNLGLIQNTTGVEILKQREAVNYLLRVSQRQ
jgi:hypothetical protein